MADPQDPNQPQGDSVIFGAFEGLKNTVTRERLKPTELEVALNVDLDDAGQVHRRRGFTRVATGNFHSLYSDSTGLVLAVKDGALGVVKTDNAFEPLLPNAGPDPLDYVRVGETIYFSSAVTSGKIGPTMLVSRWGEVAADNTWLSPVVRPTETLGAIRGKIIGPPPMATSITYWNGRIYLAHDNVVWATELYLYDYVDKTKNFLTFESEITMLATVTDGLYVGTKDAVWFLTGTFNEMRRIKLMSFGALPRTAVDVPAELVKPQLQDQKSPSKNAVLFMTTFGLCAGFDGGLTYNLTQEDVIFPDAVTAAPMFRRQDGVNSYVAVTDSGGTPSANTRIGDYVDVEIRRFQGA